MFSWHRSLQDFYFILWWEQPGCSHHQPASRLHHQPAPSALWRATVLSLSPPAFSTFFSLFPERIMLDCFSSCRNFFCSSRAVRNMQRRINAYQQPWVLNQDALKKQLKLTHPSFLAASGSEVPHFSLEGIFPCSVGMFSLLLFPGTQAVLLKLVTTQGSLLSKPMIYVFHPTQQFWLTIYLDKDREEVGFPFLPPRILHGFLGSRWGGCGADGMLHTSLTSILQEAPHAPAYRQPPHTGMARGQGQLRKAALQKQCFCAWLLSCF